MPTVGIVLGSDSDLKVMSKAADMLEKLGIDYEMTIISAHRMPDVFFDWAKAAEGKGIKVIIAGAGMAAHLPGMCAALFPMPELPHSYLRQSQQWQPEFPAASERSNRVHPFWQQRFLRPQMRKF